MKQILTILFSVVFASVCFGQNKYKGEFAGNGTGLTNVNAKTAGVASNVVSGLSITNPSISGTLTATTMNVTSLMASNVAANNFDVTNRFTARTGAFTNSLTVGGSNVLFSGSVISGANITAGSVSSNALDTATRGMLGGGGYTPASAPTALPGSFPFDLGSTFTYQNTGTTAQFVYVAVSIAANSQLNYYITDQSVALPLVNGLLNLDVVPVTISVFLPPGKTLTIVQTSGSSYVTGGYSQ